MTLPGFQEELEKARDNPKSKEVGTRKADSALKEVHRYVWRENSFARVRRVQQGRLELAAPWPCMMHVS